MAPAPNGPGAGRCIVATSDDERTAPSERHSICALFDLRTVSAACRSRFTPCGLSPARFEGGSEVSLLVNEFPRVAGDGYSGSVSPGRSIGGTGLL